MGLSERELASQPKRVARPERSEASEGSSPSLHSFCTCKHSLPCLIKGVHSLMKREWLDGVLTEPTCLGLQPGSDVGLQVTLVALNRAYLAGEGRRVGGRQRRGGWVGGKQCMELVP